MYDFPQSSPYPGGFNLGVAGLGSDTHKETSDFYEGVVTNLEPRWRIIICKNKIQWILQKRTAEPLHKGIWRGRSYVTTKEALIELCATRGLLSDPFARAKLDTLPELVSQYRKYKNNCAEAVGTPTRK